MVRFLSGDDIRAVLTYPKCIDLMRGAMETVAKDDSVLPLRQAMSLPGGDDKLGSMPGYLGGDDRGFGVKLLSLFPNNAKAGFSSHMGLYILFDAQYGEPVAVMDASVLTAIRTASATAAATDMLARPEANIMLVAGTGEQAESHIHAVSEIRSFDEVRIWGRSAEKAETLAAKLQPEISAKLVVATDLRNAVQGADILTLVTSSPTPILDTSSLEPGMHLNTAGASHRGVMEIAPDMLGSARFIVDYMPSALDQAGEMLAALDQGIISNFNEISEIGDIFLGTKQGRLSKEDVTIYKSLGIAAQDVAAGNYILRQARKLGLGSEFSM
ncbi:ornithine cyclodeaminase family protein [Parasphingorhabdus sp.]|uniref:ornithine cyclodeaminase family protein n=1 Tax=Parasphingorhabdus sp. TaxID=2709688 RepID=UPI0032638F30